MRPRTKKGPGVTGARGGAGVGERNRTPRDGRAPVSIEGLPAIRLKVGAYDIVEDAVRDASLGGWRRAHERRPKPTEDEAARIICDGIMLALSEVLAFPDPYEGEEG